MGSGSRSRRREEALRARASPALGASADDVDDPALVAHRAHKARQRRRKTERRHAAVEAILARLTVPPRTCRARSRRSRRPRRGAGRTPAGRLDLHAPVLRPRRVDARRPRGGGREWERARKSRRRARAPATVRSFTKKKNRNARVVHARAPETVASRVLRDGAPSSSIRATRGDVEGSTSQSADGQDSRMTSEDRPPTTVGGSAPGAGALALPARRSALPPGGADRRRGDGWAKRRLALSGAQRAAFARYTIWRAHRHVSRAVRKGDRSARDAAGNAIRDAPVRRAGRFNFFIAVSPPTPAKLKIKLKRAGLPRSARRIGTGRRRGRIDLQKRRTEVCACPSRTRARGGCSTSS